MQKIIDFFYNPQITHSDQVTEFRLNTFYRLVWTLQLFLTIPVIFVFIMLNWTRMALYEVLFFILVSLISVIVKKGNLGLAVHLFVALIIVSCITFMTFTSINDSSYVLSIGILICGVFLSIKETVLWATLATTILMALAKVHPEFVYFPAYTLSVDNIDGIQSNITHFSTSVILIWTGVFISVVFRWNFAELLTIIQRDNQKLSEEVEERKAAEEKVRSMNENLEQIVAERTEKLRQSEEQLAQSEKMRAIGQLAGGIAHDFNNQLTGILSCADLMKLDLEKGSGLYEDADTIATTARRAAGLISQLLSFARKGKHRSVPVDIHDVIDHAVSLLQHSIDKRISIDCLCNADNAIVIGDAAQFQSAFVNLATNSRDAMPEGGELWFITENVEITNENAPAPSLAKSPGKYLKVSVKDTGTGIEKEVQKKIFEPFFTTKEPGKGIGMGLAAVYGTMESHKGAIHVDSEIGKGTIFTLFLPLCNVSCIEKISKDEAKVPSDSKVLIIDDEEVILYTTAKVLEKAGFKVFSHHNGTDALNFYSENWKNIDVILLDMIMPDINGKETFVQLREINPKAKIIISSGYTLNGEAQELLDKGANAFIQKPYNIVDLKCLVSEVIAE